MASGVRLRAQPISCVIHPSAGGLDQAGRFAVPDVQQVGQRIVPTDGVGEITLKALRDQDCGHPGVSGKYKGTG
jgi:hypothetical protein